MSKAQHKLNSTETDNLISNLHGEVGDILLTWLILIKIIRNANRLRKGDLLQDFQDPGLVLLEILIDKVMINDESRLFEAVESALRYSEGLVLAIIGEEIASSQNSSSKTKVVDGKNSEKELLLSSSWTCPKDNFAFPEIEPRLFSFNSPYGACEVCHGLGKTDLFLNTICPTCQGKRLKPEALAVKIEEQNENIKNFIL